MLFIENIIYVKTKKYNKEICPQDYLNNLDLIDTSNIRKYQDKINRYIVADLDGKTVGIT